MREGKIDKKLKLRAELELEFKNACYECMAKCNITIYTLRQWVNEVWIKKTKKLPTKDFIDKTFKESKCQKK